MRPMGMPLVLLSIICLGGCNATESKPAKQKTESAKTDAPAAAEKAEAVQPAAVEAAVKRIE